MTTTASPALSTRRLAKRFGDRDALAGVDLDVPRGCAFGLLGPNGAGKTTLIRLLLGLAEPTDGTMELLGRPQPRERRAALARVGAIIEEPRFHAHLTGRENLAVIAAAREPEAAGRIAGALERVGLRARADDRVSGYSLGMRQRLGVARCLIADPELLILDEPMNGLDPGGIQEFRALIRGLVGEGRTVVVSSHLLDEVQRTCDVAAIVDSGRIVATGPIDELLRRGQRTITVGCDEPARAAAQLATLTEIEHVTVADGALRVVAAPDVARPGRELVTAILSRLLAAGIAIDRVVPAEATLEDLFFSLTTPLEQRA
jgi:ABC-2 type transport system ATP-binding protein